MSVFLFNTKLLSLRVRLYFLVEPQETRHNSGQGAPGQPAGGCTWLLPRCYYMPTYTQHCSTTTVATSPTLFYRSSQAHVQVTPSCSTQFRWAALYTVLACSLPCVVYSLHPEVSTRSCAQRREITGLSCCFSNTHCSFLSRPPTLLRLPVQAYQVGIK